MGSDIAQQVVIVAVGALFTLAIWGALGWWLVAERPRLESPRTDDTPDDDALR